MQMIEDNERKDSYGRLCNPGGRYFMQLAVRFIRDVNHDLENDGI